MAVEALELGPSGKENIYLNHWALFLTPPKVFIFYKI